MQPRWRLIATAAAALSIAAVLFAWAAFDGTLRDSDAAFDDFAAGGRPEALLREPLVRAGPRVLPRVLEAIKDRNFRLRRYAILHLGCARYVPALPVLERLLADAGEKDYFRGDALIAIWQIDRARGEMLVREHAIAQDYPGSVARELRSNSKYADEVCVIDP